MEAGRSTKEKGRTALILGASGLVGSHCLDILLRQEAYRQVTALVRSPLQRSHPKLVEKLIDFDKIANFKEDIEAQDIYCCLGTTFLKSPRRRDYYKIDFSYPFEIAKIAIENGAEQFALVSALTANPNALLFYSRVKGQLEQAISKLPFKSVYIMRPSFLLGERKEFRLIEKLGLIFLKVISPLLIGPFKKMRPIEARIVALAMVYDCLHPEPLVHIYPSNEIQAWYEQINPS
jgi:uncharacterized protein YbjT (DUF2867 family)